MGKREEQAKKKLSEMTLRERLEFLGGAARKKYGPSTIPQNATRRMVAIQLLGMGCSDREAGRLAEVSHTTIGEWLAEEAFAAEVEARLASRRREAERILSGAVPDVARALVATAKGKRALSGAQVAAGRDVLTRARVGAAERLELGGTVGVQARVASLSDAELLAVAEGVATLPEDGEAGGDAGG